MEKEHLNALSHKNIVKLIAFIQAPLSDDFIKHIPETEQAPYRKVLRNKQRRSIDCIVQVGVQTGVGVQVVRFRHGLQ
jgi:hypothetical protein